ncbi:hypothetical protein ACMA1D_03735, partial [Streptomyces sp. 796.1]
PPTERPPGRAAPPGRLAAPPTAPVPRAGAGAPGPHLPLVLRVRITDDGSGGADPTGSGLLGLAQRAAAIDGTLRVDSPPGGPTTLTAELPCA